ncbi:MAG: hypothetical protein NT167_02090 [Verrucomicrobia bacterium]|nr:hypothetical protein [Verrucomicrobiota bacterium]
MKKQIASILAVLGFAAVCGTPAFGQDLEALAGKWSCLKTNEDGQRYTQQIEIKKDKFTFKLADKDGDTMIYAEGDVKLDKAGPFKTMILSNIKAGQSSEQVDPIDDTFTSIYKVDGDTCLLIMNFDKERGEQFKPSLDVMRKAAPEKKAADAPKADAPK